MPKQNKQDEPSIHSHIIYPGHNTPIWVIVPWSGSYSQQFIHLQLGHVIVYILYYASMLTHSSLHISLGNGNEFNTACVTLSNLLSQLSHKTNQYCRLG